ncbi:molybdenum ABC transporter ATP-binding protein [Gammaproteobacteria bacterium 45_16_T64]|nr:molybdenum ABC transporter ATP-binding protein [Gammaproteobacteria bacterium 45_16_T64]
MSIKVDISLLKQEFCLEAQFSVPKEGITAIFGSSGSGKTTLLRAIAGLEPNVIGDIEVGDESWLSSSGSTVATHQRSVGYVFQDSHLFTHLNVRKNLLYGFNRTARAQRRIIFDEVVTLLGIDSLLDKAVVQLSGGERQRVSIGRALLSSPQLLLLDEPMAALDNDSKSEILPYLERLHLTLSIPMLYVSHSTEEVTRLADHVVLIEDGKTSKYGPLLETVADMDSRLASQANAFGILEGKITAYDDDFRLASLDVGGVAFRIATNKIEINTSARIRVVAKDVSICLDKPDRTSILNVHQAKVVDIREYPLQGVCMVKLNVGNQSLLARISRYSYRHLGISVNSTVYAQIKAVALVH